MKYANQLELSSNVIYTNTDIPVAGDSVEAAIGQLAAQNMANGEGLYMGGWDAATNTPTLLNSTIEPIGDWYNVTVAGTVDFGAGPITFALGDRVFSNGTVYVKGNPIHHDLLLPSGEILVGQTDGIAVGKTMSGDVTINNDAVASITFASRLTNGSFDGTLRSGVQYFNADVSVAIGSMVIGRRYILMNNDTSSHTITVTGASAAVIGGDALLSGLVQTVNPGTAYELTLENATTVFISAL